ncbi:hypothetical protein ABEG10_11835 [Burkholderia cenocepacia]|uniref:hypothetical protein n=1 Tax=Burkholderia cenocepacia TaxID=95486 RepID=UPI00209D3637|nr:hypothetical protein [Burkholderia cenocepacia]MCO8321118.1 hypothetical protein [Burkholderia cenocepacia]MCO8328622.1 hypothetical protein [Burkholderia cenocepacia]MCO8335908.1 hypothetical protein [Burkholderia cenocepacia]MCO8342973.1 hypothetical protein [Burkholderia cenocepacia]MCO8356255.1 hypothetical protein [Burkholderia cenocepacia]
MAKSLLDYIPLSKEAAIVVITAGTTAIATAGVVWAACDKFYSVQIASAIDRYKSDNADLRSIVRDQAKGLGQNDLNVVRLQSSEQTVEQYKKALSDERVRSAGLEAQLNQLGQGSRDIKQVSDSCSAEVATLKADNARLNEFASKATPLLSRQNQIRELQNSKDSIEATLLKLEGDFTTPSIHPEKIVQLKRVSSEYQQQILQLQQCEK